MNKTYSLNKIISIRLSEEDIKKIDAIKKFWEEEEERKLYFSKSDIIRIIINHTYDYLNPEYKD